MTFELTEMMARIIEDLKCAQVIFESKNSDESTRVWKNDEYINTEFLFDAAMKAVKKLEITFRKGDNLLTDTEYKRLTSEFLKEINKQ